MSLADQLITRGWVQHTAVDGQTGKVCLVGAVMGELEMLEYSEALGHWRTILMSDDDPRHAAHNAACVILNNLLNQDFIAFNDMEDREFDDVLKVAKEFDEVVDWMKGQAE
jgi:hypothetical protein